MKAALARLTPEGLAKGEPMFQKAWAKFQEAIDMLPEDEKNKPLKPQQVGGLLLDRLLTYNTEEKAPNVCMKPCLWRQKADHLLTLPALRNR